jgi:ribulose 1,5-bisphosphate carboxylase large subunit-like protein
VGIIELRYELDKLVVPLCTLMNEVEYGTTFALYRDREDTIPLRGDGLKWINWKAEDERLIVEVDDDFLENDYIFEKLLVAFLYNLLDFGEFRLVSIDLSKSSYLQRANVRQQGVPKRSRLSRKDLMLGTILKPYYHLSLAEKIAMAKRLASMGVNLLKEDETFFASEAKLLEEARAIQATIEGSGTYIPNVTHYIHDYHIIEELLDSGVEIVMIDFLVTGFRPVFKLKHEFPEIRVWGHRVGYWPLEKFISMKALGTLSVLSGIDFLHIGTPANKREARNKLQLASQLLTIKPQFIPVFTKTTPDILPELVNLFDSTAVFMACGYFRDGRGMISWENVLEWVAVARSAKSEI